MKQKFNNKITFNKNIYKTSKGNFVFNQYYIEITMNKIVKKIYSIYLYLFSRLCDVYYFVQQSFNKQLLKLTIFPKLCFVAIKIHQAYFDSNFFLPNYTELAKY